MMGYPFLSISLGLVLVFGMCMLFRCCIANEDDENVHKKQVEKDDSHEKGNPRETAINCCGGGGADGGDADGGGGCGSGCGGD